MSPIRTKSTGFRRIIFGLSCFFFLAVDSWGQEIVHGNVPVRSTQGSRSFQPVQIRLPEGACFAFSLGTGFVESTPAPETVGLNIGSPYRFRIDRIPYHLTRALYPSIRLLDRLNPPQGREREFPVVVELTREDMEFALSGQLVTRIVYLENPRIAAPARVEDGIISRDVVSGADPMVVAQTMGKPIAVVQIGARVPNEIDPEPAFFFNFPNWIDFSRGEGSVTGTGNMMGDFFRPDRFPQRSDHPTFGEESATLYRGAAPQEGVLTIDPALANRPMFADRMRSVPVGTSLESLVDGGDAGRNVRVRGDLTMSGLDAEDTVLVFDTERGKKSVLPSRRVQVYSPRFGSVRYVEGLSIGQRNELATAAGGTTPFRVRNGAQSAGKTSQESEALYARGKHQPEGTRGTSRGNEVVTENSPGGYGGTDLARSDSNTLRQEWIGSAEKTRLELGKANAAAWSGGQRPAVRADTLALREMHGSDKARYVFSVDDGQTPQEIRLYKAASVDAAQRGEIVEFMLRYENSGRETLRNVVVLDSLTARLEFLPESAKSSLPASFFVEPNEAGSFVLRWELREDLRPGDYGVIVFQCRVR